MIAHMILQIEDEDGGLSAPVNLKVPFSPAPELSVWSANVNVPSADYEKVTRFYFSIDGKSAYLTDGFEILVESTPVEFGRIQEVEKEIFWYAPDDLGPGLHLGKLTFRAKLNGAVSAPKTVKVNVIIPDSTKERT